MQEGHSAPRRAGRRIQPPSSICSIIFGRAANTVLITARPGGGIDGAGLGLKGAPARLRPPLAAAVVSRGVIRDVRRICRWRADSAAGGRLIGSLRGDTVTLYWSAVGGRTRRATRRRHEWPLQRAPSTLADRADT